MNNKIKYRLATLEDSELIRKFLRQHYYPEEPMTTALQIDLDQDANDEEFNISNIKHGTSTIAIIGGQIVGAFLAGPKYPDEEKKLLKGASLFPNTKYANLLLFIADVERKSNIFQKYNVDRTIHGHVMAVDKEFRGNKIGVKLFLKSMDKAKELGFQLFSCDCSSTYSAQLCEDMGMDCVNICAFADFRAPNSDAQVFFPDEKHKILKSYVKRLF